jgi:hypothetical protein
MRMTLEEHMERALAKIEEARAEREDAANKLHAGGWIADAERTAAHACGLRVASDILKSEITAAKATRNYREED